MTSHNKLKLGVLASGNGSNLQCIIDAAVAGRIKAEVAIVITDNKEAFAIERAANAKIPCAVIERSSFDSKTAFEEKIVETLRASGVEMVCLAGFMRIIGKTMLGAFPDKIINIHPSLLPSFPGLEAQKQAFDYGVKITGCTVHFVDNKVDHGPIIIQSHVPVYDDDTAESLRKRILEKEHEIYPRAIALIADDLLRVENRRVYISQKKS